LSKKTKSAEIRVSRKSVLLGILMGWMMKLWSWTLRYHFVDREGIFSPGNHSQPVIYALWHNRIFTIPPIWYKNGGQLRKTVVLTSASHDGTMLARAMEVFGIGSIRGSSSRRAVAALIGMKRAIKEGYDVCITPDGPRGPRYEFHPGVIKLAESTQSAIIPIHAQYASAWRLKTWDRLVIPKPFSRVDVTFGECLYVAPTADEVAFEAERLRIQNVLLAGVDDL